MKYLVLVPFLLALSLDCSSQEIKNAQSRQFEDLPYILSTPDGYSADQKYATIIFLHGADRSNTKHHPSRYAKRSGIDFPFIVIAPSCTSGCSWANVNLQGLLQEVSKEVSVDSERVYLTGYSMGGAGTWANLKKISSVLAAAAPLAPAGGSPANLCVAKDVAIRVYHGTADYGYDRSRRMVEMLQGCGAPSVELISLEGQGHGIWPQIFSDKEFYDWLLSNKRSSK